MSYVERQIVRLIELQAAECGSAYITEALQELALRIVAGDHLRQLEEEVRGPVSHRPHQEAAKAQ